MKQLFVLVLAVLLSTTVATDTKDQQADEAFAYSTYALHPGYGYTTYSAALPYAYHYRPLALGRPYAYGLPYGRAYIY